ncbi:MAG: sugar ABC transporter permease, partial [Clostridia bacterium]|nr:sugar ABC transporter permease [Clostridia bacterium]
MMIIPISFYIIFKYLPMGGFAIAFQDYNIFEGILGSKFVGFENFKEIFAMNDFLRAFKNTFVLSVLSIVIGFPGPIILALMLNEVRNTAYKRSIQSIVYLPHFLSWAVIAMILSAFLDSGTGYVNYILQRLGHEGSFNGYLRKEIWPPLLVFLNAWKGVGYQAVMYLAVISGISNDYYEAA